MGTFAELKKINAERGGYAGSPAVAIIDAQLTAISLANRRQPLGNSSTNHNIVVLGEDIQHIGVRVRSGATTLTTMPSVNVYRLFGPESAFTSTTLANDGTIHVDPVNHGRLYASTAIGYDDTFTAYAFTAATSNAVTSSLLDASYFYSDWARGDTLQNWSYNETTTLASGSNESQLIPTRGARAILVLHSVAADVSGGADTCEVLVYPFARGSGG